MNKDNVTNKIEVIELVNQYNKFTSEKLKVDYLKSTIKINTYVNYMSKVFYANQILKNSCYDEKNNVKLDSCKKYLLYIYSIFILYTNINLHEDNLINEYDLLESNNLVDEIIKLIPDKEVHTFDTVLKMCQDDMMSNYYELHGYIDKKLKDFYPEIATSIKPLLKSLDNFIQNIDEKQLIRFITTLQK